MSKIHTIPTFFIINILQGNYCWQDFEYGDLEFDYAIDVLEIPEEVLESVEYAGDKKIEITLIAEPNYILEDWYYALLKHTSLS